MIMEDIKRTISELEQESSLPPVGVELVDNELATLYMNSKKSEVKKKKNLTAPCTDISVVFTDMSALWQLTTVCSLTDRSKLLFRSHPMFTFPLVFPDPLFIICAG